MNVDEIFDKYIKMERHKSYILPFIEFEVMQRFIQLNMSSSNYQSKLLSEIQKYIDLYKEAYAKDIIEFVLKYIK